MLGLRGSRFSFGVWGLKLHRLGFRVQATREVVKSNEFWGLLVP